MPSVCKNKKLSRSVLTGVFGGIGEFSRENRNIKT